MRRWPAASAGPIVQEYSDNDLSTSKNSRKPRPAYLRMLQDLLEGAINAVVVYDRTGCAPAQGAGGAVPGLGSPNDDLNGDDPINGKLRYSIFIL
jgi:hypothetical protein